MAHLLGAEQVSLEFPTKKVFDGITIGVNDGDRIGIVGRNGDGKSTMLKLLDRRIQPDEGRVTVRNGLRIGLLDQADVLDHELTVGAAVVGDTPEYEWAGNPRIRDVIAGLLNDLDWNQTVGELSGGQRRRVALARLLVQDLDLVMLDEPTNHLDIEGVAWLAQHLKTRWSANTGGLIVVTHDRWFLDEVCNLTWELHDGIIEPFEGGYAAYILQRNERDRSAAASEARRQNLMRKELAWLRRGAPARTSKPKFRMDAAAELIANEPPPRDSVSLSKLATQRLGKDVIDVENLDYSVDGKQILKDVTWRLGPGDRIGLVGVNGAGKTTLLKLIQGTLSPTGGRIKLGKTVNIATLSQEVRELDEFHGERIFSLIAREKSFFVVDKKEVGVGQLVEQLGFTQAQLQTPIEDLSGGQRRRLQFLRLLFGEPNVLILDEPTNDLDTDILAAMEDLLDSWPGTLIVVSHDRYLLERVTDQQFALMGDGRLRHLPGGVDEYLRLRKHSLSTSTEPGVLATANASVTSGAGAAAVNTAVANTSAAQSASSPKLSGAALREAEKNMARIERALEKLAADEASLHQKMAAHDQSDYEGLAAMATLQAELNAKREALELEWLETSDQLG
ncbi:MAG: ABC-F family ATP-binding cassette domain-containing protein [Actinomycetales bacterium]|nr:ABC-F family ATP-binding cassette domain-containing protein [Actinomycetales bacterium]